MPSRMQISRRRLLQETCLATVYAALPASWLLAPLGVAGPPLEEFTYSDVVLTSEVHERQLGDTLSVLMSLSEDSLLKPLRKMAGQPAPGEELGGWYLYNPDYDRSKSNDGFTARSAYPTIRSDTS